jgi:hypothetical protein
MMPVKKAKRSKTSAVAKKKSPRAKAKGGTVGVGVIAIALMSVALVAVMIAARESSDAPPKIVASNAGPEVSVEGPAKKVSPSKAAAIVPSETATTGVVSADDPGVESAPASAARKSPVTIAGCLVRADEAFRLKETSGADAPRSRSWKSGFLKKGSASVDLVESGNGLKLRENVGKRVSVTGMLTDRQMRVQSVRAVAPSCS